MVRSLVLSMFLFFLASFQKISAQDKRSIPMGIFEKQRSDLKAVYQVKRSLLGVPENISIPPLDLTCYYYKKGNRVISYQKPEYLQEYPNGYVEVQTGEYSSHSFSILTDTIQWLSYFNLDSMILRFRSNQTVLETENKFLFFGSNYRKWEIFDQATEIQGMQCKKAITYLRNGSPYCEIWFNPEIEMPVGMRNLTNVPGLIVKATFFNSSEEFTLKSFSTSPDISDAVFWPKEFNEPFKKERDLRLKK